MAESEAMHPIFNQAPSNHHSSDDGASRCRSGTQTSYKYSQPKGVAETKTW